MSHPRPPTVTLVVAMRNERATIEACLASLAAQDHPADALEVMVYDGGSTDGSREMAESIVAGHAGWSVHDNPRRIQAAAWNAGIRVARGAYVGIVSGHAELDPAYVTSAVRAIEETGADMVGGPVNAIGEGPVGEAVAIALGTPFGVGGARHHYLTERGEVDTVFMGLCRRETYQRFPFDETMVRNQDDELSYRLLDAGGRIICDPAIQSRYRNRSTLAGLWRQFFDYGRWKVRVLRAHPRQARIRHLIPLGLVLALGAGLLASPFLPIARLATVALVVLYAGATVVAALRYGGGVSAATRAALLAVYPTMHLAYGVGMINGFVRFVVLRRAPAATVTATAERSPGDGPTAATGVGAGDRESIPPDVA